MFYNLKEGKKIVTTSYGGITYGFGILFFNKFKGISHHSKKIDAKNYEKVVKELFRLRTPSLLKQDIKKKQQPGLTEDQLRGIYFKAVNESIKLLVDIDLLQFLKIDEHGEDC